VDEWRRDPRVSVIFYNDYEAGQRAWFDVEGERVYPDVVVAMRDGRWIVEDVETDDSVSEGELPKWRTYSKIRADEVHLLVSDRVTDRARALTGDIRGLAICPYILVGSVVLFGTN
jgi:hypothetical protein